MKEKFKLFGLIGLVGVLTIGGMYVYVNREEFFPKQLAGDLPDISKDIETITPEGFAEMDKGVIYEITEEEKESYLNYAEALYEEYKHVGVAQKDGASNGSEIYYLVREDVIRRKNEKPEDMLNLDGSLKYPEAFTGFVISNKKYAFDNIAPGRFDSWKSSSTNVNYKANAFLLTEEFYLTYNNGNENNYREENALFSIESSDKWNDELEKVLNSNIEEYNYGAQNTLAMKMLQNGFFDAENKYTNKIFELLAVGYWHMNEAGSNAYDVAANFMYNNSGDYMFDDLENIPEKYNIVDELPEENVAYFYPTKVWKINDKTVVVDICIKNGDMLDGIDMKEIVAKIAQSNTTGDISKYSSNGTISKEDDYIVYARYFFDDLTQGVYPDGGVSIANYTTANGWNLVKGSGYELSGYTYVFNEKAKDVLRGYWGTVADKLEKGEKIDTQSILKTIAENEEIPYKDALNIWATHLVSHISAKDMFNTSKYHTSGIKD